MKHPDKPRNQPTDWDKIRSRHAQSEGGLAAHRQLAPERMVQVLQERARLLAQVPVQTLQDTDTLEVALISLGKERYALESTWVREVVRRPEHTPLPAAPAHLVGVINLRGQILPLFDLRALFGLGSIEPTDKERVLVLGQERPEFGILVDEVFEVTRLRSDDVLPVPDAVAGTVRAFLKGVTAVALLVLDGAALLKDARLFLTSDRDNTPVRTEGAV